MICAWIETSSEATGSSQHQHVGLHRKRACDRDALALAAGELVRKARRPHPAASPTASSHCAT